jgi:methylenetetrahydrofolate reductase (NADPH)
MADTSETSLQARLSSGRFVLTAEVVPPVSCDPHDLLHKAAPLKGLVDAVNVTDGAGARAHMGALAAAATSRPPVINPTPRRCSISTPRRCRRPRT